MIRLSDLFDLDLLLRMIDEGYVRRQIHPVLPLAILNYTEKAAYDRLWNDVTRQCRGLIYEQDPSELWPVVARPFPKFFNYGEPDAPDLDLEAPAVVTDKLDGSLGILYPVPGTALPYGGGTLTRPSYAVATRGSFTSDQALHATEVWRDRYDRVWTPHPSLTYLFEIIYPENRIVVDYSGVDDLVLLAAIETSSGRPSLRPVWPGPRVVEFHYRSLAEALAADDRVDVEGYVVYFPDVDARVKLKQADYVALHRILTGTNARNVWEYAAVRACADLITEPKHWGTYLGIDPARAAELLQVGEEWLTLSGVPDEFYGWVRATINEAEEKAGNALISGIVTAERAAKISDRKERYRYVEGRSGAYVREVMRLASGGGQMELGQLRMRAWREACPEPTAPFARSESVA